MIRRVMVIAGEPSGDLLGAGLIRELVRRQPGLEVFGVGGDRMAQAGMEILFHIRNLSFMGFMEVLKHLPTMHELERQMTRVLVERRPDALLLIDYPGFNLRFARTARIHGPRVFYYVSPQVWAWGRGRVARMNGLIEKMFVVFPFEREIYQSAGIPVEFVGHPLLEVIESVEDGNGFRQNLGIPTTKKLLGLFPGSRLQEVERILPVMAEAAHILQREFDCEVGVGIAPYLHEDVYRKSLGPLSRVHLISGATYWLMKNSEIAFVTSGTATLEIACFGTPMVVVYRTSLPTYLVGRALVRLKSIALVNIVAGERIVPELVQSDLTRENLAREGRKLLSDDTLARHMRNELFRVKQKLGTPGASSRVAEAILSA